MISTINKAKLHTEIYTRTDTDTDSVLITIESTKAVLQEKPTPPLFPDIDAYGHGPTRGLDITMLRTIKEIRERTLEKVD